MPRQGFFSLSPSLSLPLSPTARKTAINGPQRTRAEEHHAPSNDYEYIMDRSRGGPPWPRSSHCAGLRQPPVWDQDREV